MSSSGLIRQRMRPAAEQLMESSNLRDNLVDEQAQRLLDWGFAWIQKAAERTINLSDDDAAPLIEETATAVRLIMKFVNRLTGAAGRNEDPELVQEWVINLLKNLTWLTGQSTLVNATAIQHISQFNRARASRDVEAAFQHLMNLIESYSI